MHTTESKRGSRQCPFDLGEKVVLISNKDVVGIIISVDIDNVTWDDRYVPMFYVVRWNNGVEEIRGARELVSYEGGYASG